MIFAFFILLLCANQTYTMSVEESLSYDGTPITVMNNCPYPINVTFDASKLKSCVDAACLPFAHVCPQVYPGDTSDVVEANATKKLFFWRLVHSKAGESCEKTLSTLRARIDSKDVSPSLSCSIDFDPDYLSALLVSHKNGINVRSE